MRRLLVSSEKSLDGKLLLKSRCRLIMDGNVGYNKEWLLNTTHIS